MSDHAIPSGQIKLDWIVRIGGRSRPFMVAFHLGEDPAGKVIRANDAEVVSFSRLQRRSLAVNAGYPEHDIKSPKDKRAWSVAVANAIKAGQSVDLNNCPGFISIGGEW